MAKGRCPRELLQLRRLSPDSRRLCAIVRRFMCPPQYRHLTGATVDGVDGGTEAGRPARLPADSTDIVVPSLFQAGSARSSDPRVLAKVRPGLLLEQAMLQMQVFDQSRADPLSQTHGSFRRYLVTVLQAKYPDAQMGIRTFRELTTLATILDCLMLGDLAGLGDVAIQRWKAFETSVADQPWSLATHHELIPSSQVGLASGGARHGEARGGGEKSDHTLRRFRRFGKQRERECAGAARSPQWRLGDRRSSSARRRDEDDANGEDAPRPAASCSEHSTRDEEQDSAELGSEATEDSGSDEQPAPHSAAARLPQLRRRPLCCRRQGRRRLQIENGSLGAVDW